MGVLSYLIAGTSELPNAIKQMNIQDIDRIGKDVKGILNVQLGTLWAIISSTAYDPQFMNSEESFKWSGSKEDGPWLILVPREFVDKISSQSDEEHNKSLLEWSKSEEFLPRFGNVNYEGVKKYYEIIVSECKKCLINNMDLYFYVCL